MHVNEAINHMASTAGLSKQEVSRRLGKSLKYVNTIINANVGPHIDTLVRIASVTGYETHFVLGDSKYELTPDGGSDELYGAIWAMAKSVGVSLKELTERAGWSRTHLSASRTRGSTLTTGSILKVTEALGCKLVFSGHGEDIELTAE